MIKNIFIVIGIFLVSISSYAQTKTENPFANKVFIIDNYIDGKFDNTEDLTFTKSHVEGSICVEYGFKKSRYDVRQNEDGLWEFTCTMISSEHGKMVWEGIKKGKNISGSYLWTKDGQLPINYTFKGKLK